MCELGLHESSWNTAKIWRKVLAVKQILIALLLFCIPAASQNSMIALAEKAEHGDAASQNRLGMMYVSGDGVPKDLTKALHWFSMAADQGDAEGQYNVAVMYENGEGVKPDCHKAAELYSKAAKRNHAYAIENLISMYGRSTCLKNDDAEVARLTKQLAVTGNADAQLNLGSFYAMGRGVPKDEAEAAGWFSKAAEAGQPTAQFMLGQWYRDGRGGIPQDYVIAYKWFALALSGGNQIDGRNFLKSKLTPEQIANAEKQAAQWRDAHRASGRVR